MRLNDLIVPTELNNTDPRGYFTDDNFKTKDLIYLQNYEQFKSRNISATDFAILNHAVNPKDEDFDKSLLNTFPRCRMWLRSGCIDSLGINRVHIVNEKNKIFYVSPDERKLSHSICPCMQIDIKAYYAVKDWLHKNGKDGARTLRIDVFGDKYAHLIFGEYPQEYVGDQMNSDLEKALEHAVIAPTGKTYTGCFDKKRSKPNYYNEYEVNGKRYVRVNKGPLNDGYWVKVSPLVWEIMNWENLPTNINPKGKNLDTRIQLMATRALMAGIPFYPYTYDNNNSLWQNSTLRGFLNGIDVNNIQENGYAKFNAPHGGDFTHYNFLQQAFSRETDLLQKVEMQQKKSHLSWGIKIANKPLSTNEQLRKYIENGHTVMLHGPSGIGKSHRVKKIDPDFVSIVLRNGILPEEILGKNIFIEEAGVRTAKWQAPAWYTELCEKCAKEPKKRHVLFIDEITNVREQEQSAVFHIVLDRSIGPNIGKLPDNVSVVAAGNSMDESLAAYQMAEPLQGRFFGHIHVEPNLPDWLEWASEPNDDIRKAKQERLNIHPLVAAFVASVGKEHFCPQYDQDNPPQYKVDPRGWQQISDLIYDNNNTLYMELIRNKIGPVLANSFMTFAKTPALTVADIIQENYARHEIPQNFDAQYALAMMWRYAKMDEVGAVRQFIQNEFSREILAVYDEVWVNNIPEKAIFLAGLKQTDNREQIQQKSAQ